MDDNRIEIVARLDTSKAAVVKIEADLSKIADQIDKDHALKIIANVDLSKTTQRINSQLATIGKNLNVNVGNINLDANINTEIRQIETLGEITAQTKKEIEELKNNLANISGDYLNPIEPKISTEGYIDANATMNALKEQLSSLGTVTVTGSYGILEETQALESMTAEIKATSGEIRTLTFVWNEWDKAFEVTTGKYSDKGIGKIQQDIVRLEKELANFKASHQAIETGLIQPLTEATNAIKNLKTGTGSIETAQKALDNLKTEAAKIGANLKSTGSSFNIFDNATNKAQNFDNTIKELGIDIGKLQFTDKKSGLAESLDLAKQKLEEFRRVEGESGKGLEWSQRYAEINSLLQSVTNNLKAAKKEESEIDAFNRKLDAHNQEIQKKLDLKEQEIQKAKELNEVEMQNYWQGRFEESVKGMTAENQILKDMKKYYEDLNNEAIKAEKQQAKDENRIANHQNRISRLAAEVNRYGEANERATKSMQQMSNGKTFAVEWSRITTEMAKGADLTDREVKDLSADMAVFRKEAQAAGLAGETAFGKFLNSFKTMSSYITANMVFNFVKRQVRELVNEVTEVDTAMTELRKVTEATDKEFEAFAVSAGKTGRELGASVSDVINATAEFARLGESLPDAEELGRVATLYKNVGDGISADTAAEDIISTMKAFKIEAKDAITIVDKFNEVGNNFAISSGGIGEALKRSASALAAGNNDLSESIALITTANTVAQDSVAVGQGLKTASLRIRSTKADLEAMGEDAEGAAESTSKLRKELLALTGVDIQIDENTYKSTYNILLEISKVWRNLTDLQRSTVLEDLFGKRQANIGAAILENGDLLERVYKTSEQASEGIGSAMREQEEYAKSIQYSIDTLKAAYQDFADTVVNSDFVKSLLKTAQSFLEVLTKIIDEFGTLPTILTGIAAIGGVKNIGLFGNLENGLTSITTKFKDLKQVMLYDFGEIYKKFNINLSGITPSELNTLQNYIDELNRGTKPSIAMKNIMAETSEVAQQQAIHFTALNQAYQRGEITSSQYATATQNLALTQKTATATSKALSIALNTIANVGIMLAINAVIKGISALADKLIVTKEELDEIRNSAVNDMNELADSASQLAEEGQKLDDLIAQYKKIALSTDDIASHKEELAEIQNSLVEMYGSEAESLDLLNSKYEDTIDVINRLSEAEFNEWKYKNADKIKRAEQLAGYNVRWYDPYTVYTGDDQQVFMQGNIEHADELAASLYKVKGVSEDIQDIWKNVEGIDFVDNLGGKNTLYLSGRLEDAKLQVQQLIDEINKSGKGAESLSLLTKQLNDIDEALQSIATYSTTVKQKQSGIFEPIGELSIPNIDKLKDIVAVAGDARSEWFEAFKEIQKGTIKTVDTISSALSNLAEGNKLSSSEFWELMELDTNKILTDIQMVGNEFVLDEEQLIQLKDEYINKQISSLRVKNKELETSKANLRVAIDEAKAELSIIGARGLATQEQRNAYNSAQRAIRQATDNLADMEDQERRNNLLIDELNSKLGKTAEYTRKLADAYAKAFTDKIDKIIDGLEDELDTLNDQKDALNEQLDVLESQQDELEDMISKYKEIAGIIEDEINKEIDSLKEQQKAQEDAYNARIDALKKENEEREDALEYAQKLANLENAKNNKVRVIDETRGFRYESVKEDVVKAENDLADFENKQAIKALEEERDAASKIFDTQIKDYEDYLEYFKNIQEEEINAENERLMTEEMGSDWREQIKNKDTNILTKYQTNFRNYNSQLSGLVNNEIASLKKSITAKENEIKTKQKQIQTWKDYKTEVEKAIQTVDEKYDDYIEKLGEVNLAEDDRETSLQDFVGTYEGYVSQIKGLQDQLSDKTVGLYVDSNIGQISEDLAEFLLSYGDAVSAMAKAMEESSTGFGLVNSPWDAELADAANKLKAIRGNHAQGGVVDYTGLAMLHGSPTKSETVFNASDSKKLYDLVHSTPNLMADMMTKATKLSGFNLANMGNTSNSSVSIGAINVYANNPTELANGLDKQLDKYFQTKLTANYTRS